MRVKRTRLGQESSILAAHQYFWSWQSSYKPHLLGPLPPESLHPWLGGGPVSSSSDGPGLEISTLSSFQYSLQGVKWHFFPVLDCSFLVSKIRIWMEGLSTWLQIHSQRALENHLPKSCSRTMHSETLGLMLRKLDFYAVGKDRKVFTCWFLLAIQLISVI